MVLCKIPLLDGKKREIIHPKLFLLDDMTTIAKKFINSKRVCLNLSRMNMRYAGPRESLFHAIIRRNYGCTHFIIGRDHAGVEIFYKKYEAHELATKF